MFGFFGLLILVFSPLFIFAARLWSYTLYRDQDKEKHVFIYSVAAFGSSLGFALLLMLHPFSTELSEWGIWIIMTSALSVLSHQFTFGNKVQQTEASG